MIIPQYPYRVNDFDDAVEKQTTGYIGKHLRQLERADEVSIRTAPNGLAYLCVTRLKMSVQHQISRAVAEELAAIGIKVEI